MDIQVKPIAPRGPKKPKKVKQYKKPAGISAEEFERRLLQRERALTRKYASASSPQLGAAQRAINANLRGTKELIGALVDPANSPPFRLPGGGRPTFVNKLHYVQASSVPAASAAGLLVPNSGFAVARRDPRCAFIFTKSVPVSPTSIYVLEGPEGVAFQPTGASGWVKASVAGFEGGVDAHGDFLLPWVFEDGVNRFWFQNESVFTSSVAVDGLPVSTNCNCTIDVLLNGAYLQQTITAMTDATGHAVFQCTASPFAGYAAFRFAPAASPNNWQSVSNLTMNDNSSMKVCHQALPQFWTNYQDIDTLRINAASLMFSDRTAEQYSQGDIVAYQASGADEWAKMLGAQSPSNTNLDPYTPATEFQDMYEGGYKKGRFIPLKLTDDPRELELLNLADAGEPYEIPPIVFSEQRNYLYIGFNVGVLGSGVPSPIGKFTAYYGIEGETESQWRETRVPSVHPDVLKEAKWVFSQIKCDFENPTHLSKIWSWVKRNAPHILDIVDLVAPVLPPQARIPAMAASGAGRAALKIFS